MEDTKQNEIQTQLGSVEEKGVISTSGTKTSGTKAVDESQSILDGFSKKVARMSSNAGVPFQTKMSAMMEEMGLQMKLIGVQNKEITRALASNTQKLDMIHFMLNREPERTSAIARIEADVHPGTHVDDDMWERNTPTPSTKSDYSSAIKIAIRKEVRLVLDNGPDGVLHPEGEDVVHDGVRVACVVRALDRPRVPDCLGPDLAQSVHVFVTQQQGDGEADRRGDQQMGSTSPPQ
jgi:hypothetical protein